MTYFHPNPEKEINSKNKTDARASILMNSCILQHANLRDAVRYH